MTPLQKIQKSSNMVAISQIILGDVWVSYSVKFTKEHRPFIRANESQQDWIDSVNSAYTDSMVVDRKQLFDSIPSRFFRTRMYNELAERIVR